ncbi:MAG TPA: excinuclease ABC subunit UvrC [Vicinamibacterales bacterium]|nr:excinuclease ABC subunit UvrC [Vicinamibacterales bacterium]
MAIHDLKEQMSRLPHQPGVYIYSNAAGDTLYVGKARSLRDRVRSYLGAYGTSPRHDALLDEAARVDVIVTDSVVEALALENNLIKQRYPRYNILLRDDKNYPYLQLTVTEAFPRVLVARAVERNGDYFAGPFLPAKLARRTMGLTHKIFGIRSCNEVITGLRARPCLEYDIGRCLAPCVATICTHERYAVAVADTRLFLEGRTEELAAQLRARMAAAAADQRYEEAAQLRDAIRTVDAVRERQQKMATAGLNDRDVIGLKLGTEGVVVQVFAFRGGRVIERFELQTNAANAGLDPAAPGSSPAISEAELLEIALQQLYTDNVPPPEIHVPLEPNDQDVLESWLSARAERRVRIVVPQRGDKKDMVELAQRNAAFAYRTRFDTDATAHYDALERLKAILKLPSLPRRIECFDISTIQGSETVASMVVCEDGRMKKSEYRKYRVRGYERSAVAPPGVGAQDLSAVAPPGVRARDLSAVAPPGAKADDFAAITEVVGRRYRKLLEHGGPFPDLIVIDGGKGQLRAAYEALEAIGLANLIAVGLAKKEELVFSRDSELPIAIDPHSPALRLLQRIRDEAHRFAVTFHRQQRASRDLRSELDVIPGVGARRRKQLLTRFGSVQGVRRATREELTRVVGAKAADAVIRHFANAS